MKILSAMSGPEQGTITVQLTDGRSFLVGDFDAVPIVRMQIADEILLQSDVQRDLAQRSGASVADIAFAVSDYMTRLKDSEEQGTFPPAPAPSTAWRT